MTANDDYLIDLGLAKASGEATQILATMQPNLSSIPVSPSSHVNEVWREIEARGLGNNVRGNLFELLLGSILLANGIQPFFSQAEVTFVNNARFDFLLWEDGWNPISLSIKTSLRERYKQAELEAWALKSVHRKAENWLITLNKKEVLNRRNQRQSTKEHSYLDGLVLANEAEFDNFILDLQSRTFSIPNDINPMQNSRIVKSL